MTPRPVFLLTDFGLADWYVGALKSVLFAADPATPILDIAHGVPPHDVHAGAFMLHAALPSVPPGAVILAVVDPGVGTSRRARCGHIGGWFYSGPDNGLAEPLLERAAGDHKLYQINNPAWRAADISATFHGRDLFAPAAARLAAGADPSAAGPAVPDPLRLPDWLPRQARGRIDARVMLVDRFGNCVTNLRPPLPGPFTLPLGNYTLDCIHAAYGDLPPGAPLLYWGSAGTLELALNGASAAAAFGLAPGSFLSLQTDRQC